MAVISKGIELTVVINGAPNVLNNLTEIPALGGSAEAIEVTTLASVAREYTDGIMNYGDSLAFKFLYEKEQFTMLNGLKESAEWEVTLPDGSTCNFSGTCAVSLDGVGVNAALTYTLNIKPNSAMTWV